MGNVMNGGKSSKQPNVMYAWSMVRVENGNIVSFSTELYKTFEACKKAEQAWVSDECKYFAEHYTQYEHRYTLCGSKDSKSWDESLYYENVIRTKAVSDTYSFSRVFVKDESSIR
jgi:hypothetical protein